MRRLLGDDGEEGVGGMGGVVINRVRGKQEKSNGQHAAHQGSPQVMRGHVRLRVETSQRAGEVEEVDRPPSPAARMGTHRAHGARLPAGTNVGA